MEGLSVLRWEQRCSTAQKFPHRAQLPPAVSQSGLCSSLTCKLFLRWGSNVKQFASTWLLYWSIYSNTRTSGFLSLRASRLRWWSYSSQAYDSTPRLCLTCEAFTIESKLEKIHNTPPFRLRILIRTRSTSVALTADKRHKTIKVTKHRWRDTMKLRYTPKLHTLQNYHVLNDLKLPVLTRYTITFRVHLSTREVYNSLWSSRILATQKMMFLDFPYQTKLWRADTCYCMKTLVLRI